MYKFVTYNVLLNLTYLSQNRRKFETNFVIYVFFMQDLCEVKINKHQTEFESEIWVIG